MLIGSTVWAEIHVFVCVVAATVAVRKVGRGIMEGTIVAWGPREDGAEFSDAGEDVGGKLWGRIPLDGMHRLRMEVVMGKVSLRFDVLVNRRAPAASRLARRTAVALVTLVTSTAARRGFTL